MLIEIHGAGFINKGAELMLRTVVDELSTRIPESRFCMDTSFGSFLERSKVGLLQIFPHRSDLNSEQHNLSLQRQIVFSKLWNSKMLGKLPYIGGNGLSRYGCVSISEVDAIIDISGYAFTDHFGTLRSNNFSKLTSIYHARKKPIVLLPQAFGPYDIGENRIFMTEIIQNSTIIYARDNVSYNHLMTLSSNKEKIQISPDITFSSNKSTRARIAKMANYVCVVPNTRMLDQGRQDWGDIYLSHLQAIITHLLKRDIEVYLISHEHSEKDRVLVLDLFNQITEEKKFGNLKFLEENDPVILKDFLGNSFFIVSSRYHSMIAALSYCTPVIALGWSHKYKSLLEDFKCSDLIFESNMPVEILLEKIDQISDFEQNNIYRTMLKAKLFEARNLNKQMWNTVEDVLQRKDFNLNSVL